MAFAQKNAFTQNRFMPEPFDGDYAAFSLSLDDEIVTLTLQLDNRCARALQGMTHFLGPCCSREASLGLRGAIICTVGPVNAVPPSVELATLKMLTEAIWHFPCPVVGIAQNHIGNAGLAILASCDSIVSLRSATFSCQSGPSSLCVGPLLGKFVDENVTRRWLSHGFTLTSVEAAHHGLVSDVMPDYIAARNAAAAWLRQSSAGFCTEPLPRHATYGPCDGSARGPAACPESNYSRRMNGYGRQDAVPFSSPGQCSAHPPTALPSDNVARGSQAYCRQEAPMGPASHCQGDGSAQVPIAFPDDRVARGTQAYCHPEASMGLASHGHCDGSAQVPIGYPGDNVGRCDPAFNRQEALPGRTTFGQLRTQPPDDHVARRSQAYSLPRNSTHAPCGVGACQRGASQPHCGGAHPKAVPKNGFGGSTQGGWRAGGPLAPPPVQAGQEPCPWTLEL